LRRWVTNDNTTCIIIDGIVEVFRETQVSMLVRAFKLPKDVARKLLLLLLFTHRFEKTRNGSSLAIVLFLKRKTDDATLREQSSSSSMRASEAIRILSNMLVHIDASKFF
jgi:hypothetical protein